MLTVQLTLGSSSAASILINIERAWFIELIKDDLNTIVKRIFKQIYNYRSQQGYKQKQVVL